MTNTPDTDQSFLGFLRWHEGYKRGRAQSYNEGYTDGVKDGYARGRKLCRCDDDEFDVWSEVFEAAFNMGHQAALDGR